MRIAARWQEIGAAVANAKCDSYLGIGAALRLLAEPEAFADEWPGKMAALSVLSDSICRDLLGVLDAEVNELLRWFSSWLDSPLEATAENLGRLRTLSEVAWKLKLNAEVRRVRAERKLGELQKETPDGYRAGPGRGKKGSRAGRAPFPTNRELGISADLSSRSQKLAELPQEVFEKKVSQWRENVPKDNERVTTNLLKAGDKKQKHTRRTFGTGENEWFTPAEYIEVARRVMGEIDLDPATSDYGQKIVKAVEFFTPLENGLAHPWHGRVWLNPPYSQPDIADFVAKLVSEFRAGRLNEAILLTHNYTDKAWFHEANSACSAMCFTRGRVKFQDEKGNVAAPTQGQIFFYFGRDIEAFATHFQEVGSIDVPFRGGSGGAVKPSRYPHSCNSKGV